MNCAIECLIFDLFGVLVAFDDGLVNARLAAHCDDPVLAEAGMRDLVSTPDLICGRLSLAELRAGLVAKYGLQLSADDFAAIWLESYSEPMPGMRQLLRELTGRCRLVLLSNVDPFYWPIVRDSIPELEHFDALSLSFENGFAKPDTRAFCHAIERSGCPASACLFVDDKPENIEAAARSGLRGHHFTQASRLRQVLNSTGLLR